MAHAYWGDAAQRPHLPARAERMLVRDLGLDDRRQEPVALGDIALEASRLASGARRRLEAIVGRLHVRDDHETRVRHAVGSSYVDLVRLRAGTLDDAPDAVVAPAGHDEVRAVLERCTAERVAVVPFGGGTSVVGGVAPLRDGFEAVVTLDCSRMDRLVGVDRASLLATLEPGVTGSRAEARLGEHQLTLGHFPQSFERASIGGYVATRSAGQASTGYGRIDDLVEGLRVATPVGDLVLGRAPASAAGPDLRALLVGSEGTLGVITEATLRVRPAPAERHYEGWSLPSFAAGCEVFRTLVQADLAPDAARLSDEAETEVTLAQAGGAKGAALRAYLRARGYRNGCLVIVGWEGAEPVVRWRRKHAARALRRHGGVALGTRAGDAWRKGRFAGPYLRDELLDRGALVETLETACHWSSLDRVYERVGGALRGVLEARDVPAVVLCHVSHVYATGASLYFTVIAGPEPGMEIATWREAKRAASDAIAAEGATITHHHAVGADHRPWMGAEVGDVGLAVLAAVKERLDPAGIMNPGKLLP